MSLLCRAGCCPYSDAFSVSGLTDVGMTRPLLR